MEAFDLAVGLWPVGAGLLGLDVQFPAGVSPEVRFVGRSVVGEDPLNCDATDGKPRHGTPEHSDCGGRCFIGVDLCIGEPGMVVDDRVDVSGSDQRLAVSAPRLVRGSGLLADAQRSACRRRRGCFRSSSRRRGSWLRACRARTGG